MKKSIWTLLLVFSGILTFAQIPNGYYDDAAGLSGAPLKTALYQIIKGHNTQSYNSLWIHFESTDAKPNGKVWDMYSDVPGGNPPYEYNFGDDQCGNYGGEGDCYNREHSFPKSWFNNTAPMNSDLFHIVPTDGYVNGKRSNWPYGETNNPSWTSENGCKLGSNSTAGYSGTVFEPIDEYKGDFARGYFYMATRYENIIASWENNSSNADAALDGTSYPCFEEWLLNILLAWDQQDPVSQKEIDRNNAIYDIQNNRNPFIDHPEYVTLVWGNTSAPIISNVSYSPENPDENIAVNVTATISDDGSITSAVLHWGLSSSNLNNNINMSANGTTYTAQIPGQAAGQQVYFQISATDNESNSSNSAIYNYQVNQTAGTIALPFTEDFNDATLGIFYQYSVTGPDQYWSNTEYNNSFYAKMSNYDGSGNIANEDWMITPAINFDAYSNEVLTFASSMKDYNDNTTHIYLMYSSNYSGAGDPNNASWTDISSMADWSTGDYTWVNSGEISLANISGTSVYLAFKYDSQDNSGKTWQIDDVSVTADGGSGNQAPQISNISFYPTNPGANEQVIASATITDDQEVDNALILWGNESTNISNIVAMTNSGSSYSGTIPGQEEGKTVYFKIQAYDNEGAMTETDIFEYSIENTSGTLALPFMENFENGDLGIFNAMSIVGPEQFWHNDNFDDNLYAKMSNYNGAENLANEDWLITPPINFDNYTDEILQFRSAMKDYNDNNCFIYLKISSNYDGVSDPNTATWTDLSSQANWSSGDYTWEESGEIDLSSVSGSAVYLAFEYVSAAGTGKTWEVDNVNITLNGSSNLPPVISNITQDPEEPDNNDLVSISAQITDDQGLAQTEVYYGTSPTEMTNNINMSGSSDIYSCQIPAQDSGTTIYYRIKAEDTDGAITYSSIQSYYVKQATAIIEIQKQSFSVYPNPAKNYIQIASVFTENIDYIVYHSSGKIMKEAKAINANAKIDISDLAPGYYILRITDGNISKTSSFVVYR